MDVVQDSAGGVRFEDSGIGMEGETDSNRIVVPERGEYYVVLSDRDKSVDEFRIGISISDSVFGEIVER